MCSSVEAETGAAETGQRCDSGGKRAKLFETFHVESARPIGTLPFGFDQWEAGKSERMNVAPFSTSRPRGVIESVKQFFPNKPLSSFYGFMMPVDRADRNQLKGVNDSNQVLQQAAAVVARTISHAIAIAASHTQARDGL